jgi:uncharacterized protein (TIGR04222 family)
MEKTHLELWQKIAYYDLDDPKSAHPFSKKLMHEQKLTSTLTQRTIAEYKKFIFLVLVEPQGASPSQKVDEVWHLHITFTKNYADFCEQIAGNFIHHNPSKGGAEEVNRHALWYKDTLIAYVRHFDAPPPPDIWDYPAGFLPENYLRDNSQFTKPTTVWGDSWQKTEEPYSMRNFLLGISGLLLLMFLVKPFSFTGPVFLQFYAILAFFGLILNLFEERKLNKDSLEERENDIPKNLSPISLAWFTGGKDRFFQTALLEVIEKRMLLVEQDTAWSYNRHVPIHDIGNPLIATLQCLEISKGDVITTHLLQDIMRPSVTLVERQLGDAKKRLFDVEKRYGILVIILLVGFIRLIQGVTMGKPVLFLILLMIVICLAKWVLTTLLKDDMTVLIGKKIADVLKITEIANSLTRFACCGTRSPNTDWGSTILFASVLSTEMPMPAKRSDASASSCGADCGSDSSCGGGDGGCSGGCGGCGGD